MRIVIPNIEASQLAISKDALQADQTVLNMLRSVGYIMETLTEGIGTGIAEVREIMKRELQCIGSFFYNALRFCSHMEWDAKEVLEGDYNLTLGIPLFDFKTRASVIGGGIQPAGIWTMYLGRLVHHLSLLNPSDEDTIRAKVCLHEAAALFYAIAMKRQYEIEKYLDMAVKSLIKPAS